MKRRNLFAAVLFLFPPPLRGRVRVGGEHAHLSFTAFPASRAIGAAYLRAYPADPLADAHLAARLPPPSLAARVRDDFAAGRVVMLDGWMLSVTEARLCALAVRAA